MEIGVQAETVFHVLTITTVLGIAVFTDVQWRRIPNAVTGPALIAGLVLNSYLGGWEGLLRSTLGMLVAVAFMVVPVAMRWWGAGDLKLFAALGAIGGPVFILWAGLYSFVAGGAMALAILLARRQIAPMLAGIAVNIYTKQAPQTTSGIRLPFAVPIAVGALIAMVVR